MDHDEDFDISSHADDDELSDEDKGDILRDTVDAFTHSYELMTPGGFLARRAHNCMHTIFPEDLDVRSCNNDDYIRKWLPYFPLMQNCQITEQSWFCDTLTRSAVFYAHIDADTPIGPYRSECVFFLHMTNDWEELVAVEEFVDTKVWGEWWPRMREFLSSGRVVMDAQPEDSGAEDE